LPIAPACRALGIARQFRDDDRISFSERRLRMAMLVLLRA